MIFPKNEVVEQERIFPEGEALSIPKNIEELSAQTGLVEMSHTGLSFGQSVKKSRYDIESIGIDEVRKSIEAREKETELSVGEDLVRKAGQENLVDVSNYFQQVLERHKGKNPQALEEAVVAIITPKGSKEYFNEYNNREAAKNLAARNIFYDTLFRKEQNATFWERALSFGREVIPFVNSRSVAKGVAEAFNRDAKWSEIINPSTIVNEFRDAYLIASPEKKEELVAALVHGMTKYSKFFGDDNAAQIASNLQKILQFGDVDFLDTSILDIASLPVASAVSIGKAISKGIVTAAELGKPARVAIRQGNPDAAVDLMVTDALKGTSVSGMTPDEIARMASSMNISPLEFSFDSLRISQPLQDKLKDFATSLREQASNILLPGNSAEEVAKGLDLLKDQYSNARNRAIYEYSQDNFSNGIFTGTVRWQSADGIPFRSKEAAEAWAAEYGKTGKAEALQLNKEVSPEELRMLDEGAPDVLQERWIFTERVGIPTPVNAIGKFSMGDVSGRNFFNLNIPFLSASKEVVAERGIGLSANAKLRRTLENTYKESVKGLSGGDLSLVNRALTEGDALSNAPGSYGKVWASDELRSFGMSERGAEAYYKLRLLRDNMWLMRNRQMVNEMKADGFKELAFDGNEYVGPLHRPAKPIDLAQIKSLTTQGKVGRMLDTRNGAIDKITSEQLDRLYEDGGVVVRLYKSEGVGGRKYSHIIIDNNSSVMREISSILPYRPGEFARVYSDEYFITLQRKFLDEFDIESPVTETIRTARNPREAAAFVKAHNQALKVAIDPLLTDLEKVKEVEKLIGTTTNPADFLVEVEKRGFTDKDVFDFHYNRETHSYLQDTIDEALTNGRLFYSKRGEKLLSIDPTRANTLPVTDSLGIELANISRFITSKDIRVNAIEKWNNTFGEGVVNRTFNKWTDFDKGELSADLIKKSLIKDGSDLAKTDGDELLRFAEQTRKYIRDQLNIRTADQKLNEARWRKSIEWLEERSGLPEKVLDWFGPALRKSEVADFLRKVNFHITLGMGNMAQLLVQANGMFIASAVHPVHGLAAAKTAIPLRMALMSDNPNVWKSLATVDSLSSLGLRNINEFVDIVKAVKRSGIIDDIHSTALYNVENGALDLFKGYSKDVGKQASTFFFNRGEEMSRLVSWEVARREWVKTHPGVSWNTDDALKQISMRQKEFNLGMQTHNTAAWQQGWAGIPLQFLQYNLKLATSLIHSGAQLGKDINKRGWTAFTNFEDGNYRGFNPAQASKLLAAQIVLYGAAGNGLRVIANEMFGDESGMSEEQKMYISEGLAGGLFYSLTKLMDEENPAKLALGKRLGSFEWYNEMFDKIVHDKTDVTDFLLGATKSSGVKALDIMMSLARVFYYGEEQVSPEMVLSELGKAPEIMASVSNAVKAYTYLQNEGFVTSKDGSPIARVNKKENLAAFLGISSVQVQEYYESVKDQKKLMNDLKDLSSHIKKLQIRELDARLDGNIKTAEELEKLRWAMMPRDLGHRRLVDQMIRETILPGDTAFDKLRFKFETQLNLEREKFRVLDRGQ